GAEPEAAGPVRRHVVREPLLERAFTLVDLDDQRAQAIVPDHKPGRRPEVAPVTAEVVDRLCTGGDYDLETLVRHEGAEAVDPVRTGSVAGCLHHALGNAFRARHVPRPALATR